MIKQYCNVIEDHLIENVIEYLKYHIHKDVWGSNLGWNQNLGALSSNVLTHDITSDKLKNEIKKSVEKAININFEEKNLNFFPLLYIWTGGSYITWHEDDYPFSGTIYLNKEWNSNDGGLFLFKDNFTKKIFGIEPSYNTMVVNSNIVDDPCNTHCVTCIVPGTVKKRITIQWRTAPKSQKDNIFTNYV